MVRVVQMVRLNAAVLRPRAAVARLNAALLRSGAAVARLSAALLRSGAAVCRSSWEEVIVIGRVLSCIRAPS